jgi:hypothetical protein
MSTNLPERSVLYADSACTDYTIEEMLADDRIRLLAPEKQAPIKITAFIWGYALDRVLKL